MPTPQPGIYRKGQSVRIAESASEAVDLVFVGYTLQTAESIADGSDYRDLQKQAKELGIPANQPKAALAEAIANHEPDSGSAPTGAPGGPDLSYVSPLGDGNDEFDAVDDES